VLVTIGTDHHPFDRLVAWADGWYAEQRELPARCVIQSGSSRPPAYAEWKPYLAHEELQALMDRASAVVTHGGPGTIIECRRRGILPIVTPRRPELGESVDDHQIRFSQVLAMSGEIVLSESEGDLRRHLSRVSEPSSPFVAQPVEGAPTDVITRFAERVDRLVDERSRRRSGSRS
jgi:UDP-N-acetylglucosamine transferase subunit ALG13